MTIETPQATTEEKRKAGLAKARQAKAAKKKAALESPSRTMSEAEVREKRAKLMQELADLPSEAAVAGGATPGSIIKDGLGFEKVPWTPAALRDACNRNLTMGGHTFSWKTLYGDGKILSSSWNGIVYWIWPDRENKIPSVHYEVYMQAKEDARRENTRWRSPQSPSTGELDGYNSAEAHSSEIGSPSNLGHIMGLGPLGPDTRGQ